MVRDERGYIVVETIGSFMLFSLLIISILTLINIVAIQTRVHYAVTQTANELSMYCYVIDALGLSDDVRALDETGQQVQGTIDSVQQNWETFENAIADIPGDPSKFFDNLDTLSDAISGLGNVAGEALENPKDTFVNIVRFGLNEGKNLAMQEWVIRPTTAKYLQNGDQSADTYLRRLGVGDGLDGLDFSESSFVDSDGDITIVVSYEIDYTFGALPLPFNGIKVMQTAKTRAWLGGVTGSE